MGASGAELLFDVDYGGAVEDIQAGNLQAVAVDGKNRQFRNRYRVGPDRTAGGKDTVESSGSVSSRIDLENVAGGLVQPEKHNNGLAGNDTVEPLLVLRIDLQGSDSIGYIEIFRRVVKVGDIAMEDANDFQPGVFHFLCLASYSFVNFSAMAISAGASW